MKVFKRVAALLLLPALALVLCACTAQPGRAYSLVVWYAADSEPLAAVFETLTADYNSSREKGAAEVTLLGFEDEAALTRALDAVAVPDLLLCSHALAFTLADRGLLKPSPAVAPDYPAWLTQRSACVGRGFYPVGFDVLILRSMAPQAKSLSALLSDAAAYGEERGDAFLCVDSFAPLFYQVLLTQRTEFTADFERFSVNSEYVNLYNQIAEAVFSHGLTLDCSASVPCRLAPGSRLRAEEAEFALFPAEEYAAEGHGIAVLSREPRLQRDLLDFLRWLLTPQHLGAAALDAGLIPAVETDVAPVGALETLLLAESRREFHLPDAESKYYVNRSAFEASLREALLLLP